MTLPPKKDQNWSALRGARNQARDDLAELRKALKAIVEEEQREQRLKGDTKQRQEAAELG